MLNVYRIDHKYAAAYTSYIQTVMSRRELSDVTVALEIAFYEAQGKSHEQTIAPPDLAYLLVKYYGCLEVSHRRWQRTCTRHRKKFDIYWNSEGHRAWKNEAAVIKLVPADAFADIAVLPEIMRPWYAKHDAEAESWMKQLEDELVLEAKLGSRFTTNAFLHQE